jgi:hypothetical protein
MGHWAFPSSGYALGDEMWNATLWTIVANTNTTGLRVGRDILNAYYGNISGSSYEAHLGSYIFPCNSSSRLHLRVSVTVASPYLAPM